MASVAAGAFRNCQVAAPLKRLAPRRRARQGGPFRNCQVAAPLKRAGTGGARRRRYAFRNCQVAAPLKQWASHLPAGAGTPLPQLSSCGPIEAYLVEAALEGGNLPSATVKLRPH